MTDTIISSATKEVAIGFGRPFVMIGERINPTGRKLLAEEMKNGDFSRVVSDAIAQVEAGAQMLDAIGTGPRWVLEHRGPIRSLGMAPLPGRAHLRSENLDLPLSSDGQCIDMLLVVSIYG